MKTYYYLLAAILLFSLPISAQKKAFELDDIYKVKGVSSPQISPSGDLLLYSVTTHTLTEGKSKTEHFVQNLKSKLAAKIEVDKKISSLFWGTDDETIFCSSSADGSSQIYKLNLNDKTLAKLTQAAAGINSAALFSSGKYLVFASDVYPELGNDTAEIRKTLEASENGPIQAYLADKLLFRHWTEYSGSKVTHLFLMDVNSKSVKDITPYYYNCPSFSLGESGFTISPDEKYICYSANPDENKANSTNADLWLYDISNNTTTNITSGNKAWDGSPEFSPDGKKIAYKLQKSPGYESDLFRIAVYDIDSHSSKVISDKFDNWVASISWSPDGELIYFTAEVGGYSPLYSINPKTESINKISSNLSINGFQISKDGKTVYYDYRLMNKPADIYALNLSSTVETRLTEYNKDITEKVDFVAPEQLWITGAEGKKIHVFLVKPHDFDPNKKYPLIVNVHGGPQSQWMDAYRPDAQLYSGYGYIVALPNPHGSTGYGQEYTAAISGDWGGKVFQDVMMLTDSLSKLPYVDLARIGAMGWSYGGYMMNWLQGQTKRYKCLVSMMGLYNVNSFYGTTEELWFPEWDMKGTPWENPDLYQKYSPANYVNNFATPTLIITGERDYRVSYTQSLEYFTALQKENIDSKLIVFKNDGHWPSHIKSMPLYYNSHLEWFNKYLGGKPAPYDSKKMVQNRAFDIKK